MTKSRHLWDLCQTSGNNTLSSWKTHENHTFAGPDELSLYSFELICIPAQKESWRPRHAAKELNPKPLYPALFHFCLNENNLLPKASYNFYRLSDESGEDADLPKRGGIVEATRKNYFLLDEQVTRNKHIHWFSTQKRTEDMFCRQQIDWSIFTKKEAIKKKICLPRKGENKFNRKWIVFES